MKVAVASNQSKVADHFSKCEGFRIYEFSGETIHVDDYFEHSIELKSHLADLLKEKGVNSVITGHIGEGQIGKLKERGITVISGIEGEISEVILKMHCGELESVESTHEHQGCGGHDASGGCGCSGGQSKGGCGC